MANGKGRLDYVERLTTYAFASGTPHTKMVVDSYDALGRTTKQTTHLKNASGSYQRTYPVEQAYNKADQVTQVKYPSLRTVNHTYDRVGRVTSMNGNLAGAQVDYVTAVTYNAASQPLKESWGTSTALYLNRHYNNRLQNYDIRLGTSSTDEWGWNRGALRYYYNSSYAFGDGGTNNNGNLWRAEHFIPLDSAVNEWAMATQYFDYDALNRIKHVEEFSETWIGGVYNGPQAFKQAYIYDRFGNRQIDQVNTTTTTGVNKLNYDITQATNRVAVPSGVGATITYDVAGNMVFDSLSTAGGSANRVFDAMGKMIRSNDGGQVDYVYDHAGHRVRKKTGTGEKWYIYGIQGELLAEYGENIAASSPNKELGYKSGQLLIHWENGSNVKWVVPDVLGTARMYVDYYGDLTGTYGVERYDHLPFGEELVAGVGVRTTGRGYQAAANSSTHPKGFTGQLHDNETGLDNFGARYHNAKLGRFVGVDPHDAASQVANPQGWNRYSYVRNQPTSHIDPDGMKPVQVRTIGREQAAKLVRNLKLTGDNYEKVIKLARYFSTGGNDYYVYSSKLNSYVDLNHLFNSAMWTMAIKQGTEAPLGHSQAAQGIGSGVGVLSGLFLSEGMEAYQQTVKWWAGLRVKLDEWGLLSLTEEEADSLASWGDSAWDPEDRPSNVAGHVFGAVAQRSSANVEQLFYGMLRALDVLADPRSAPGYNALPEDDAKRLKGARERVLGPRIRFLQEDK